MTLPLKCTSNGTLNSTFTQILFFAIFTSTITFNGIHISFAVSTCLFITIVRVFLVTKLITVRILKQFKMSGIRRIFLLGCFRNQLFHSDIFISAYLACLMSPASSLLLLFWTALNCLHISFERHRLPCWLL